MALVIGDGLQGQPRLVALCALCAKQDHEPSVGPRGSEEFLRFFLRELEHHAETIGAETCRVVSTKKVMNRVVDLDTSCDAPVVEELSIMRDDERRALDGL